MSEENTKYRFRKSTEEKANLIGIREGDHPLMIAFHAENLSRAFPYIDLKFVEFGPEISHTIVLEFSSGWQVKIVGHNLGPLFQMIVEQNTAEVSANLKAKLLRENESSTFAESIEFIKATENGLESFFHMVGEQGAAQIAADSKAGFKKGDK